MKNRIALAAVAVIALGTSIIFSQRGCGPVKDEKGRILVAEDVTEAVWSGDSRSLFYVDYSYLRGRRLVRYEVSSGRRETCSMPEYAAFGISPDGKKLALARVRMGRYQISIQELGAKRAKRIAAFSRNVDPTAECSSTSILSTNSN